ncbi:MAG: hypothetical protein ACKOBZ_05440 [Nitrospira sp.]|nr:hypothetical protein [Nitrospira sp.]
MSDPILQLRQSATIARVVGVMTIALGFMAGMQGLDDPGSGWLPTAQGLIVTGLLAQGYALWCTIRWKRERAEQEGQKPREDR